MDDGQRDWIGLYILGTNYPYRELNFLAKFIRIFWYALKRFHADQIAQRAALFLQLLRSFCCSREETTYCSQRND